MWLQYDSTLETTEERQKSKNLPDGRRRVKLEMWLFDFRYSEEGAIQFNNCFLIVKSELIAAVTNFYSKSILLELDMLVTHMLFSRAYHLMMESIPDGLCKDSKFLYGPIIPLLKNPYNNCSHLWFHDLHHATRPAEQQGLKQQFHQQKTRKGTSCGCSKL